MRVNCGDTSTWPHPSFTGTPLPETRQLDANGFSASWRAADFGRPYPPRWTNAEVNHLLEKAHGSAFGVSLVQPVDIYQQAERAVKYAVLFIVLTFLICFLWEIFHATALYGFLYLLLRLEDYALLAGSVGLFVILALVMYVTRRMNWYDLKLGGEAV